MSRVSSFRIVPWSEALGEIFTIADASWTPPATVRSTLNPDTDRLTLRGVFTQVDGSELKLTAKLERDSDGVWWGVHQQLDIRLFAPAKEGR